MIIELGVLVVFVEEKWFWRKMVCVDCILCICGVIFLFNKWSFL